MHIKIYQIEDLIFTKGILMYQKLIDLLSKKPELYEPSTAKFWDDEHISNEMLKAHLDPSWDAASRNHAFITRSVDWITQIAPPLQYTKLLDLGCGPGLYAERFCKNGYGVTGIDYSHRSITYARSSALQNGSDIIYIYQDYLELSFQEEFDVITLIYCDFCVMSENNRKELLKRIFKALKPGGKFILDVTAPKAYEGKSESRDWFQQESGFWSAKPHVCISSHSIYPEDNTRLNQTIIITKDNMECYNIWDHIFTEEELRRDLNTAGFYNIALYGDIAGADYNTESKVICAAATKEVMQWN